MGVTVYNPAGMNILVNICFNKLPNRFQIRMPTGVGEVVKIRFTV
jgi:hypothetical protein